MEWVCGWAGYGLLGLALGRAWKATKIEKSIEWVRTWKKTRLVGEWPKRVKE
jgi:hypothetical protein